MLDQINNECLKASGKIGKLFQHACRRASSWPDALFFLHRPSHSADCCAWRPREPTAKR